MQAGYWQQAFDIGRSVYLDRATQNVDEQAGPAYFATTGLSRWLFWQRLKWAARQIETARGQVAVDFGCGFGLLLPRLRQHFQSTVAVDLMPQLAEEFMHRWDQSTTAPAAPNSVSGRLHIVDSLAASQLGDSCVDLIVALDVLEHFESLDSIVDQLARLLKPNGLMLVSGPTENWLYKLGRRIVGFSGEYHHQTIYDVHAALKKKCQPISQRALPQITPLFLMSLWRRSH